MRLPAAALFLVAQSLAGQQFYRFHVNQDALTGAPDFSELNQPLTAADRVFIRDGGFYRIGPDLAANTADDTRVRFFGMNLAFAGNFPAVEDAARIARRLRKLGVNLVRLHHLDTSPDINPDDARSILTTGPYPTLNEVSVRRLRAFLDALAGEGIYVNLNLHVGYQFRPAVDGISSLPQGMPFPSQSKPLQILHPRLRQLQVEFTRKVIGALALRGNTVLAMVEINNESSPVDSWQRGNLDRLVAGDYRIQLQQDWNEFLAARYPSTEELREHWGVATEPGRRGLSDGESLSERNISLVAVAELATENRTNDYLMFLAERHRVYLDEMLAAIREETDALVPVAGTQLCFGGLLNYDSHRNLDYQDHHFYVDHYNFPNVAWDGRDWRVREDSVAHNGYTQILNVAAARQAGRPYTVSEFNQPWPNTYAAELNPVLSVLGSFQDWDSIMHFAYEHGRGWDDIAPRAFNAVSDWTKYPLLGQSAWLYRSGAIEAGRQPLELPVSRAMRLKASRERRNGAIAEFLRTAAGYDPKLALVHPVRLVASEDASMPGLPQAQSPYEADTGQFSYDAEARVFKVHAPRAAGVLGFVGESEQRAGELTVRLGEASRGRGFIALLLTPLDGKLIFESRRLLLSTPGFVLRSQPGAEPPRPQQLVNYQGTRDWWTLEKEPGYMHKPSGDLNSGRPPAWMERVESIVTLRIRAERLRAYPLNGSGGRLTPLSDEFMQRLENGYRLHLQAGGQEFSPWYEIVAE